MRGVLLFDVVGDRLFAGVRGGATEWTSFELDCRPRYRRPSYCRRRSSSPPARLGVGNRTRTRTSPRRNRNQAIESLPDDERQSEELTDCSAGRRRRRSPRPDRGPPRRAAPIDICEEDRYPLLLLNTGSVAAAVPPRVATGRAVEAFVVVARRRVGVGSSQGCRIDMSDGIDKPRRRSPSRSTVGRRIVDDDDVLVGEQQLDVAEVQVSRRRRTREAADERVHGLVEGSATQDGAGEPEDAQL